VTSEKSSFTRKVGL